MGWKCTPQFTGLVRNEPKEKQKHRSNAERIIAEVGKERVSKSDTLDKDRSYLNRYTGFESGFECLDYIMNEADTYVQEVIGKGGAKYKRKLRSDAVIGYAIIYNPPEEVCKHWDDATYQKFYEDSRETMEQICPDIFRKDTIIMTAEHYDEGTILDPSKISRHRHDIGIPKDENGRYCGTKIDAKLYADVNKYYPQIMRGKGWDIEDLDCTDWNRYNRDKDYREERKAKQQSGKSVNDYIAKKMREQMKENEVMAEDLQKLILDVLDKEAEFSMLEQEKDVLEAEKEQMESNKEVLRAEREQFEQDKAEFFKRVLKQEKKEKEFQHREDMLDAQRKVLDEKESRLTQREKEMQTEQTRYKLNMKAKYEEKMRNYKSNCDEKLRIALKKVNTFPNMSETVERILDSAYVRMRMGEDMPARNLIEKQQRWNESRADAITDSFNNEFDDDDENSFDDGMGL